VFARSLFGFQLLVRLAAIALLASCGGGNLATRPYPTPNVEAVKGQIAKRTAAIASFRSESLMDYWLGDTRVKGTVWILGRPGKYLRFNGLSPAGDTVIADLACNGKDFAFIDVTNNCQRQGLCDRAAIEQFLRISLAPDDFLLLANGSTPMIPGTATLRWDSKVGHEILMIKGSNHIQTVALDGRNNRWDIVSSSLRNARNEIVWIVENKDFAPVVDENGKSVRMPKRTRMRQPDEKADLIVRWRQRKLNLTLGDEKFELTPDPSIPHCPQ